MADSVSEEWRPIRDYKSLYEVSNYGRIKSLRRNRRPCGHYMNVHVIKEKILKTTKTSVGYKAVSLSKDGTNKIYQVHRIVAETFISNHENYPTVNHKDGIKDNNLISNLEWVTQGNNNQHAYNLGLRKRKYNFTKEMRKFLQLQIENRASFTILKAKYSLSWSTYRRMRSKI